MALDGPNYNSLCLTVTESRTSASMELPQRKPTRPLAPKFYMRRQSTLPTSPAVLQHIDRYLNVASATPVQRCLATTKVTPPVLKNSHQQVHGKISDAPLGEISEVKEESSKQETEKPWYYDISSSSDEGSSSSDETSSDSDQDRSNSDKRSTNSHEDSTNWTSDLNSLHPVSVMINNCVFPVKRFNSQENQKSNGEEAFSWIEEIVKKIPAVNLSESDSSDSEPDAKTIIRRSDEATKQQVIIERSDITSSSKKEMAIHKIDKVVINDAIFNEAKQSSQSQNEVDKSKVLERKRRKKLTRKIKKKIKDLFGSDTDSENDMGAKKSIPVFKATDNFKRKASPVKEENLQQPKKFTKVLLENETEPKKVVASRTKIRSKAEERILSKTTQKTDGKPIPKTDSKDKKNDIINVSKSVYNLKSPPLTANKKMALQIVYNHHQGICKHTKQH